MLAPIGFDGAKTLGANGFVENVSFHAHFHNLKSVFHTL